MLCELHRCIKQVINALKSGAVLVSNLLTIRDHQKSFSLIVKEMDGVIKEHVKQAVELRISEYGEYQNCEGNLKQFIDMCHRFGGSTIIFSITASNISA